MGKLESIIKSEILRLTKRELRAAFLPLKREVHGIRIRLSRLSKTFKPIDRLAREQMRQVEEKKLHLEASMEEAKSSRLTPERIRLLRNKIGISQKDLGLLTGVTMGAVASWEKGKFRPNLDKRAILVAIRKQRIRDVKKILASKRIDAKKNFPQGKKPKIRKGKGRKK
jgi:DNA-binding transcriptional regulator YiaG